MFTPQPRELLQRAHLRYGQPRELLQDKSTPEIRRDGIIIIMLEPRQKGFKYYYYARAKAERL